MEVADLGLGTLRCLCVFSFSGREAQQKHTATISLKLFIPGVVGREFGPERERLAGKGLPTKRVQGVLIVLIRIGGGGQVQVVWFPFHKVFGEFAFWHKSPRKFRDTAAFGNLFFSSSEAYPDAHVPDMFTSIQPSKKGCLFFHGH